MQYIKQNIYDQIQEIKELIKEEKIDTNEGYLYISLLVSQNSSDPTTKTGVCIVNDNHEILSYGYNDTPKKFKDSINWNNKDLNDWVNSKYPYVLHAERQAVYSGLKQGKDLTDATMYMTLFPCNECALAVIEGGIKKIYYISDKYHDRDFSVAARKLFDDCEVKYEQIEFKDEYILKMLGGNQYE